MEVGVSYRYASESIHRNQKDSLLLSVTHHRESGTLIRSRPWRLSNRCQDCDTPSTINHQPSTITSLPVPFTIIKTTNTKYAIYLIVNITNMAPNIHLTLVSDQTQLVLPEATSVIPHALPPSAGHHGEEAPNDEASTTTNLNHLVQLLTTMKWDAAIAVIQQHHDDIASHVIQVVCQGETYTVSPMHFAVGTIVNCPIPVLEALVQAHPNALLQSDTKRGLSPVHLGLIKGTMGMPQINYLLSVCPELTLHADIDGNLPLHLAVKYASDAIIQCVLQVCPAAAGYQTKRQRYALHLFATSHCQIGNHNGQHTSSSSSDTSISTLKALTVAYPYALQQPDLQGRLPLHLATCTPYPRWDVVQFLCDAYPDALLMEDEHHKIPLQLLKRFSSSSSSFGAEDSPQQQQQHPDSDIILTLLQDRTNAEKRKKNTLHKILRKVVSFKKRTTEPASSESDNIRIDLMNCYG